MKQHLFFLGIAGHAMAGLALAAQHRGYTVSGLDEAGGPPMSDWLTDHKLAWSSTYDEKQLEGVDAVVISGHHGKEDHPVIKLARERNLRIESFAELLGELTLGKHVLAVAGTHGKTTTTSFITWLLEAAGRKPDYLIGIRPFNFDASSRLDGSDVVVVEADEYKASTLDSQPKFNYYHPNVLVLTSVEHDHPDVYPTMESYVSVFEKLAAQLPADGRLVACAESETVMAIAAKATCRVVTYGLESGDYMARNVAYLPTGIEFDLETADGVLGRLAVPLYGRHNVLNSLAAAAVAMNEGLTFDELVSGAAGFKGAFRRFNVLTPADSSITVIDDYAHHPTEAKAMIEAVKLHFPKHRLVVVYRPHTYSRTQTLLGEYHQSFGGADELYITDVEPAREAANQRTVSGQEIIDGLPQSLREHASFISDRSELIDQIQEDAEPGDVVLCMTVSGYAGIANELAEKLLAAL